MSDYFIARDGYGDVWLWRENGEAPEPFLSQRDIQPHEWDAVVDLFVKGAS